MSLPHDRTLFRRCCILYRAQNCDHCGRKCDQRNSSCDQNVPGSHNIVTRLYSDTTSRRKRRLNVFFPIDRALLYTNLFSTLFDFRLLAPQLATQIRHRISPLSSAETLSGERAGRWKESILSRPRQHSLREGEMRRRNAN